MKKNNIKFVMNTDWIFDGVIDAELKQYVLLGYFQKLNKQLEDMKVYPMFTEITLHLANVQSIIKNKQILYTDKNIQSIDDEITFIDLKMKDLPEMNESEKIQLKEILEYSLAKLQDYFDIIKSIWTVVYDSIEIISILNEDNIESKKGYFYFKKTDYPFLWEYNIKTLKDDRKFTIKEIVDKKIIENFRTPENKLPVFYINCEKDVPLQETLLPLLKRKVMSYVMQTKNLAIK